jgi:hypothetical protein
MKKLIFAASFFVLIGLAGTASAGDGIGVRAGLFGFDIVNVNIDLPSSSGCVRSSNVYYVTSPDPSLSVSTSPQPAAVKEESRTINVVNSTNVNITVQESKSTSVQPSKPVVIYYPSQTRSYYYYRPFGW